MILQHGALLLEVDDAAWHKAVGGVMEQSVSLRALGVHESRAHIIRALCAGMQSVWNIEFEDSQFLDAEMQAASLLHERKYALAAWNENSIDGTGI